MIHKSKEPYIVAAMNDIFREVKLFEATISPKSKEIMFAPMENRHRLLELYTYLYKRPELAVKIFKIDINTFYFDKFEATNSLVTLFGYTTKIKPMSLAIKEYLKKYK